MRYRYPTERYEDRCICDEETISLIVNTIKGKEKTKNKLISNNEDADNSSKLYIPFEGRQLFTRWRWSHPTPVELKAKTFHLKYKKKLSSSDKILLNNFQQKYLYHAIDDILYSLKSRPTERDNLLNILYSPVLSLQNNFSIDFFDIWIDEIYINEILKVNKFLANDDQYFEPFSYITIRLLYTNKFLTKKPEPFW